MAAPKHKGLGVKALCQLDTDKLEKTVEVYKTQVSSLSDESERAVTRLIKAGEAELTARDIQKIKRATVRVTPIDEHCRLVEDEASEHTADGETRGQALKEAMDSAVHAMLNLYDETKVDAFDLTVSI